LKLRGETPHVVISEGKLKAIEPVENVAPLIRERELDSWHICPRFSAKGPRGLLVEAKR
jgi:hypothetical protein